MLMLQACRAEPSSSENCSQLHPQCHLANEFFRSVAKGMVVGKAPGGGNLVVGGGDGGAIPPEAMPAENPGVANDTMGSGAGSGRQVGFGNQAPLSEKSSGLGEPLGS